MDGTYLYDTHAHQDDEKCDGDRAAVIEKIRNSGVGRLNNIGSDMQSSRTSIGLAEKYDTGKLILTCIAAYTGITVFAVFMKAQWQFWVLAIFVGMFQGGIQALSRSYFAKIVPPERSGEYFGLMDICGKGASFMGTTVVGLASQAFGSINIGVSAIVFLFIAGALFFMKTEHSGSESTKNQENVIMGQQMFHN